MRTSPYNTKPDTCSRRLRREREKLQHFRGNLRKLLRVVNKQGAKNKLSRTRVVFCACLLVHSTKPYLPRPVSEHDSKCRKRSALTVFAAQLLFTRTISASNQSESSSRVRENEESRVDLCKSSTHCSITTLAFTSLHCLVSFTKH